MIKCSKCIYRTRIGESGEETACFYLGYTGKRRGCPVDNCDKFKEGRPILADKNKRFHL